MNIEDFKTIEVHISTIQPGDTILHLDGHIRTVSRSNIRENMFVGRTLFGDSYNLGTILVKKILI